MDNTKLSYSERWQRVVLTVIRDRGRVGCIGYLTGISLLFEPALYLKLMGGSIIGYLSFILALQWEGNE